MLSKDDLKRMTLSVSISEPCSFHLKTLKRDWMKGERVTDTYRDVDGKEYDVSYFRADGYDGFKENEYESLGSVKACCPDCGVRSVEAKIALSTGMVK